MRNFRADFINLRIDFVICKKQMINSIDLDDLQIKNSK